MINTQLNHISSPLTTSNLLSEMNHFLILGALMAILFVKLADAQLPIPLPPLPVDLPIPALPLLPLVPAVTVCPPGYFSDLVSCYPCPRGSTSTAGVTCFICPTGFYAPGAGSAICSPCAEGYMSAPAGETCYMKGMCATEKSSKKDSKRRLREGSDVEEVEEESESMFAFLETQFISNYNNPTLSD